MNQQREKGKEKVIVLLGTLDTKGHEIGYLKREVEKRGLRTCVVDAGVLGDPPIKPDISREEVARAAGRKFDELLEEAQKTSDRMPIIRVMIEGATKVVARLHQEGKLNGIASVGGSMGMAIGVIAMRALPTDVPKLMVATHFYPQYLSESGLMIFQCPTDLMGLNPVTNLTLRQAAGAICGMVEVEHREGKDRPLVAVTGLGVTTQGVMALQPLLRDMGYDTVVFHGNSAFMDQLIERGTVDGVIDFSPNELIRIFILSETPDRKNRLDPAGRKGLPQVIVPGSLDMIVLRMARDQIPEIYRQRKIYLHGPYVTGVRTTKEELALLAKIVAGNAKESTGPVALVFPLRGFSAIDREGKAFYDPDTDRTFLEVLKEHGSEKIEIFEVDAHITDEVFVKEVAKVYDLIAQRGGSRHG